MSRCFALVLAGGFLMTAISPSVGSEEGTKEVPRALDFKVKTITGKEVELSKYQGKVVLVVNVASKCGLTPQYEQLQALHKKYGEQGLAILGFPCNQFGQQEPGDADEIEGQCLVNYGVSFPMFEKIDVNGKHAHPIYRWLKAALPGTLGGAIKWNFTKFLVDRNGRVVERYAPTTKPEALRADIEALLDA